MFPLPLFEQLADTLCLSLPYLCVASGVTGDYKIMFNIEDDCMTCNSYVVFSQIKKPSQAHFFIYVDRHGNWVVGEYFLEMS